VLHALGTEPTAALNSARLCGASVNDVLLAAFFQTIATWNRQHTAACDRIGITMPLNARPPHYRQELLGNLSRIVSIAVTDADLDDPLRLLATVTRQTGQAKRVASPHAAGLVGAVLGQGLLPYPLRRALLAAGRFAAGALTDTTCLSNVGRISDTFHFGSVDIGHSGNAGDADRVWASPPAPIPRGLSVGAATYGGRLHLTVRYRHTLLDAPAAEAFTALLADHVHDLTARLAAVGAMP
jgi:NRPS condensation-like uncharacterized protein